MLKDFAISIARTLHDQGYQAYLVGGCVRDLLLGREPADYDIATDATPEQVMRIFPQTYAVGARCDSRRASVTPLSRKLLLLFKSLHRKFTKSHVSGFGMNLPKCLPKARRGVPSCCSMKPDCCMSFFLKSKP